jgi:S1-C subfamily serine protease
MHRLSAIGSIAIVCGAAVCACCWPVGAVEISTEEASARLAAATVTVRILPGKSELGAADKTPAASPARAVDSVAASPARAVDSVTVLSGVCVGPGLIATFVSPAEHVEQQSSRFRITLPDGEQARAVLRVVDHYSGLLLLEIPGVRFPFLPPADGAPRVGAQVLTAAAAGVEKPAVSSGIVGGVDRSPGTSGLPPLLQCDVRTSETSSGAAIVDRDARLLGVIAVTRIPGERMGWTYAVPERHVRRLLAAKAEGDKLVILERQRPSVGLTMQPGPREGTVEVEHVVPGGAADKAGIRQGDLILEADGRKIRSAYQAVDLILNRQPGDKLPLVVAHGDEQKDVDLVLEGQSPTTAATAGNVGPQLKMRVVGRNQIEVQNHAGEVGIQNDQSAARSPGDELEMLKIQLAAFEKVIGRFQAELRRRDKQQAETDEVLESLRGEVDSLRKELTEKSQAGKRD